MNREEAHKAIDSIFDTGRDDVQAVIIVPVDRVDMQNNMPAGDSVEYTQGDLDRFCRHIEDLLWDHVLQDCFDMAANAMGKEDTP